MDQATASDNETVRAARADKRRHRAYIQHRLNAILAENMPRICYFVASLYALIVVMQTFLTRALVGSPLYVLNIVSALAIFAMAIAFTRRTLLPGTAHAVFSLVLMLVLVNSLLRVPAAHGPAPGAVFCMLAVACLTFSLRWFLFLQACCFAGTLAVGFWSLDRAGAVSLLGLSIVGIGNAGLIFAVRMRTNWRSEELKLELESKNALLEDAAERGRKIQARYRSMLDSAADIIFTIDTAGQPIYLNPVAERILTASDAESKPFFLSQVAEDYRDAVAAAFARQVADKSQRSYVEYPLRTVGGDIWLGQVMQAHDELAGQPSYLVVARDITKSVQAADALQRAKDEAEAASKSKSEFLANTSHEIRTPLNGIIGVAELMLVSDLTEDQRDSVETILESGNNLLSIVNDVLDLSKIEAGKLALDDIDVDIQSIVCGVRDLLAPIAAKKRVSLTTKFVPEDWTHCHRGDPKRIRQVLTNIVGNAMKFTDEGSVSVLVERVDGAARAGADCVRVTVKDTGTGIAPDRIGQIFSAFTQGDMSVMRRFGGTGLGLTISQRLVGMMGGNIDLSSKLGEGSTFVVSIPLEVSATPRDEGKTRTSATPGKRVYFEGTPAVLLVEDNPRNLSVQSRCLELLGCRVASARDGAEAVRMAHDERFDVIFMDVHMPVMDGLTATREIRRDGPNRTTPIVGLTASAMEEDRRKCSDAGMDHYLTKPVRVDEIARTIADCLPDAVRTYVETATRRGRVAAEHAPVTNIQGAGRPLALVVDDDPVVRKALTRYLDAANYDTIAVPSGKLAIEAFTEHAPDVSIVILDMSLGDMSGVDVANALLDVRDDVYFVVCSGYDLDVMQEEFRNVSHCGFIQKPFNRQSILAAVEAASGVARG